MAVEVESEVEICRDFKKGDCSRGSRCKFSHPKLDVCRDFQTKGCGRGNCKFVHVTHEEELLYGNSGKLPAHINTDAGNKNGVMNKPYIGGIPDFGGMYGKRLRADSFDLMGGLSPMVKRPFMQENHLSAGAICRDFDKGNCSRGSRCKYYHPKLRICRDSQNDKCERETCRFLHITREEEDAYENSGKIPDHIDEEKAKKNRIMDVTSGRGADSSNMMAGLGLSAVVGNDLCYDFDKGKCSRGSRCKYYHPKLRICRDFQNQKCERETCRFLHMTRDEEDSYESSGEVPDHIDQEKAKKSKIMNAPSGRGAQNISAMLGNVVRGNHFDMVSGLSAVPQSEMQENQTLKQKIAELQKQITDLHQMNDTLYEQNAMYRKQMGGAIGGIY